MYAKWAEGELETPVDQNNIGIIALIAAVLVGVMLIVILLLKKKAVKHFEGKRER